MLLSGIFLLLLVGLANASVNMSYDSTSKMWNITNSYRSYYINATNAIQYTNHPSVYWSQNAWCFNNSITGFRCADTESGFTWTNRTDNSTYALLVGTKTYTFTGGRTLKVTINYYLNDTNDWIQVVPNLNGNFNFVGTLTWRTHNIQIGGWKYWDWARVWLTNGTNDYPLNTTTNKSFPASMIANKSYYLYDSNTSEYAQTWWDRNLGLNITKGTEYNDYMDLNHNISMSGTWQTNFTLWWVDAIPCYFSCTLTAPSTNLLRQVGQLFTLSGHWHFTSGACNPTASMTAQYQNSTGSWVTISTTTNLSTTSTNPQTTVDGDDASWTVKAGTSNADIFAYYNVTFAVNNKGYSCQVAPGSKMINVTYNSSCNLISGSTTFTANTAQCQNITASNIVIDCNGFGVLSDHSIPYSSWGFRAENVENITIKNCLINDTQMGIYLKTVKNANLTNNTITNLYDSDALHDLIGGWTTYAFRIDYSNNTRIENNTVYHVYSSGNGVGGGGTGEGIELYYSNYTTAQNNSIDWLIGNYGEVGGGAKGIWIQNSNFNNFTKNRVNNSQDTLLYFYSGYNNSFTNNIYSNATYGVYLGAIDNLTFENEVIRGNGTNMNRGMSMTSSPSGTNSLKNVTITNVTAYSKSACLFLSSYTVPNNFSISNCSYGVYDGGYSHGFLANSTIAQTIYDYYGDGTYNNTFLNVSFSKTKTYFNNANLSVQWYARVNVTNSAGTALTSTINVSSNLSQPVYYGYQSVSPYFEVNDTLFGSGAMTWNNHSIVVNLSGYTTNLTYFNISYRDATINVTLYTAVAPDTTPPNVNINTPTYQQNVSGVIRINATVNDSGGMDASKVYYRINSSTTNVTGWVQMTNVSSGGQNYYNATFNTSTIADGWYNVTVNATDLAGNQNTSVSQPFRIDNTAPTLTFVFPTPANASNLSQTWVYVNVSVNEPADNCSLNWNTTRYWLLKFNSTVWYKNMTSLANGNYTYNATCNDTMGFNASTENRTVRLDTVAPTITLVYPTPINNANLSQNWVYINITTSEDLNTAVLNWSGTPYPMTRFNASVWYLNRTGLAEGTYTYNVWANDTTNNTGNTSIRNVTLDTTAPTITFVTLTPPDNSVWNYSWVYVNITTSEPVQTALLNWSGTWYSMTALNSTNWYKNVTGLPDGIYNYSVYVNDTANNTGTASRNLTIELLCTWINQSVILGADRYKCQNITSSNITLDCNGHSIWLNSSSPLGIHGIRVELNYNTTIKNCIIDGGQAGIIFINDYLLTSKYNYIYNNTIRNTYNESATGTTTSGMILYADGSGWDFYGVVENNTIYNITANCTGVGCSATAYGIFGSAIVQSSFTNNNISKVTANSSGYGFYGINDPGSTGIQFVNFTRNNFENIKTMDISIPTINTKINFFNNTYRNSKQVAYCSSGQLLPTVDGDSVFGTSNTTIGYQFINALGDDAPQLNNVLISDVKNSSSSYAIIISGSSLFGVTPKLANITIANSSRAIYLGSSGTNITDSNITNSSVYDAVLSSAYNTTFLNTTFNKTNVSLTNSNLTVQWYARVNVTNSSGDALVATINDTDNQSNAPFYGYYSLTPFYIVNDSFLSNIANFSFNNHTIIANRTLYTTNITSFNFSGRDYTVNISLSTASASVLSFVYPTPDNNANLSQNWTYINVSSSESLSTALLDWNGTWLVMSSLNATVWYLNVTNQPDGTYIYNVSVNSTFGINANSSTRNVTLDTIAPAITFVNPTPTNASTIATSSFFINVTINEPAANVSLMLGGTLYYMLENTSTNWYFTTPNLADNTYHFNVSANDSAGNIGISETRTVTINTVPAQGGSGGGSNNCVDGTLNGYCSNVTIGLFCRLGTLIQRSECEIHAPAYPGNALIEFLTSAGSNVPPVIVGVATYAWDGTSYWANQAIIFPESRIPGVVELFRPIVEAMLGILLVAFTFLREKVPAWLWLVLLALFMLIILLTLEHRKKKKKHKPRVAS